MNKTNTTHVADTSDGWETMCDECGSLGIWEHVRHAQGDAVRHECPTGEAVTTQVVTGGRNSGSDQATTIDLAPLVALRDEVVPLLDDLERRLAVDDVEAYRQASEFLNREQEIVSELSKRFARFYAANGWDAGHEHAANGVSDIALAIAPTGDLTAFWEEYRDRAEASAVQGQNVAYTGEIEPDHRRGGGRDGASHRSVVTAGHRFGLSRPRVRTVPVDVDGDSSPARDGRIVSLDRASDGPLAEGSRASCTTVGDPWSDRTPLRHSRRHG